MLSKKDAENLHHYWERVEVAAREAKDVHSLLVGPESTAVRT
jgi:hypothetical protein